jgi:hypothetical protein
MTARESRAAEALMQAASVLTKLVNDTAPVAGNYPPEDDDSFDPSDYHCGNEDDAVDLGEQWGIESRNRTLNPALKEVLDLIRTVKEEMF